MNKLLKLNDWAARRISDFYANPLLIWASICFSIIGAFVAADTLNKMLYWSNSFQLVFCFVSIYVASLNLKAHHETKQLHKELHAKLDTLTTVKAKQ